MAENTAVDLEALDAVFDVIESGGEPREVTMEFQAQLGKALFCLRSKGANFGPQLDPRSFQLG